MVLKKALESPLDSKEIKPVNPKGNQPWIFIGRTDVEAETPIFWPLMQRANSLEKTQMLGKIESKKRRGQQKIRWLDGIIKATFSCCYSCSIGSDTLWPRKLQQARLPCPPLTPRVCKNSCPLSRWCHPTISSSVVPFSSCPQSFPASGSFLMSQLFASVAKILEFQVQHQAFQWTPRTDLL